jgi:predicted DCC family thiol-disulfide oxidoreductase YuxK
MFYSKRKATIFFDDECAFCRRWIRRWQKITRDKIAYVPCREHFARYPQAVKDQCERSVLLIVPGGKIYFGAEAVFRALALAGRYRFLFWFYARSKIFSHVSEAAYRWVARHRK